MTNFAYLSDESEIEESKIRLPLATPLTLVTPLPPITSLPLVARVPQALTLVTNRDKTDTYAKIAKN